MSSSTLSLILAAVTIGTLIGSFYCAYVSGAKNEPKEALLRRGSLGLILFSFLTAVVLTGQGGLWNDDRPVGWKLGAMFVWLLIGAVPFVAYHVGNRAWKRGMNIKR
jgi:hypothetical protein